MATAAMCSACSSSQQLAHQQRRQLSSRARPSALLPAARRTSCAPHRRSRCVVVRADSNWSTNSVVRTVDTMLKRYDFVSTGLGALCVTAWCWSHGQPPLQALSITAVSTIIALVVNELVFTGNTKA